MHMLTLWLCYDFLSYFVTSVSKLQVIQILSPLSLMYLKSLFWQLETSTAIDSLRNKFIPKLVINMPLPRCFPPPPVKEHGSVDV